MQMKNRIARRPRRMRPGCARIIAVAILPFAVAGCQHDRGAQVAGWTLIDPAQRHPILVSQQPVSLNLHVARGSQGLNPMQRARVLEFVSRSNAADAGNSRVVIAAPGGSANEGAAMEAADEARQLMVDSGYSEASIAMTAYHAGGGEAPLRISYMRFVADAPDCGGDWSENLAANYQNTPYPNMGCASQRNLAVMVANPADLLGPRTVGEREANRRYVTFQKYINGDKTGAKVEDTSIGKVLLDN